LNQSGERTMCWVGWPGGIGDDHLRDRVDRILPGRDLPTIAAETLPDRR
jgi:hypothetical protein